MAISRKLATYIRKLKNFSAPMLHNKIYDKKKITLIIKPWKKSDKYKQAEATDEEDEDDLDKEEKEMISQLKFQTSPQEETV